MNFAALPDNLESTFVSNANPYLPARLTRLSFPRNSFIGLGAENPSVGAPMQIMSYSLSESSSTADYPISYISANNILNARSFLKSYFKRFCNPLCIAIASMIDNYSFHTYHITYYDKLMLSCRFNHEVCSALH